MSVGRVADGLSPVPKKARTPDRLRCPAKRPCLVKPAKRSPSFCLLMEFCLFMGFIVPCFLLFYKYFKGFSNHVVRFSSRRCALLWPVKATKSFMQSAASTRGQKRHWRIRKQRATVNLRPSQSQIARIKHHINSRVRNVPDAIANIARPACRLSLRGNPSQGFPRTPPVLLAGCQDLGALPQTPLGIESPDPLSAARSSINVRHKAKSCDVKHRSLAGDKRHLRSHK